LRKVLLCLLRGPFIARFGKGVYTKPGGRIKLGRRRFGYPTLKGFIKLGGQVLDTNKKKEHFYGVEAKSSEGNLYGVLDEASVPRNGQHCLWGGLGGKGKTTILTMLLVNRLFTKQLCKMAEIKNGGPNHRYYGSQFIGD